MWDFTGKLLAEVCPDVTIEPDLQPLEGESFDFASANHEENARVDIRARGFWGRNRQCAFFMSRFLTQTRNPIDGHPLCHASGMRKLPRNENMSSTSLNGAWLIYAPGLLHLRRNGELGIHVQHEIGFSPVREETRGLLIHTGLDLHPPQFFPAPVCYHVHTGSSIKHQARCEGMRQLRPRYS